MGDFIEASDLAPFATIAEPKAEAMIADAEAMAVLTAPCITDEAFSAAKKAAVKAILRAAILRWNDSGSGAVTSKTAGPFGQTIDTTRTRRALFWPSEIEQLQDMCSETGTSSAFAVDTVGLWGAIVHSQSCDLYFGGQDCSCGAVLTQGYPLYGE